jgi:hypothetical protein
VLLNKALRNGPQDFGPNFTNSVYTPITGTVEDLVRRGVDSVVLHHRRNQDTILGMERREIYKRVFIVSDTLFTVSSPCTHSEIRVDLCASNRSSQEILQASLA